MKELVTKENGEEMVRQGDEMDEGICGKMERKWRDKEDGMDEGMFIGNGD
ncbi:hypothetical protein RchiOBHm_Chr2g0141771 [Rosa chinensis]|uniref:Uncharacterized protein n=1 Tax=Rosa chinensis TaxID=74649 RepID=A0A2P6RXQ5_ROSCH|nr:hypothetical protein RchiOBHm_Chr2g0141771 [Rosa chinensis]